MKLIYCTDCHDILSIRKEVRSCSCGKSKCRLIDRVNATISGPCIPLGISGSSFRKALHNRGEEPYTPGTQFTSFVIETKCPTIKVLP